MAGLYEVKQWLRGLLWYVGVAIIAAACFAWNGYDQLRSGGANHYFLLSITVACSLTILWILVLLFFFSARRLLDPTSFINRLSKLSFRAAWGLLAVVLIGAIIYAVQLYSDVDILARLRSDQLDELITQIEARPTLLHKGKSKDPNALLSVAYESGNARAVGVLLTKGARFDSSAWTRHTPVADSVEDPAMLRTLLSAGLSPNQSCGDGLFPIHHAASLELLEAVQLLLEAGADIEVIDRNGRTALMHSLAKDGLTVFTYLLDMHVNVNMRDGHGDTALHKAVRQKNPEAVRLLIEKGANAKVFNYAGFSPIHIAAINGQNELIEIFAEYPGLLRLSNREGEAPFDYALRGLKYETASLFLQQYHIDINRIKSNGQTALHAAIEANDEGSARFLLQQGASAWIPNSDGLTAYDLMKSKRLESLLQLVDSRKRLPQTAGITVDESIFP